MSLDFERWEQYYPECVPLWWEAHSEFVGEDVPFGPNVAMYETLDRMGNLMILVARDREEMVGYLMMILQYHPHTSVLSATEDTFYLREGYRKGTLLPRMVKMAISRLQAVGVKQMTMSSPIGHSLSSILGKLEFEDSTMLHVRSI